MMQPYNKNMDATACYVKLKRISPYTSIPAPKGKIQAKAKKDASDKGGRDLLQKKTELVQFINQVHKIIDIRQKRDRIRAKELGIRYRPSIQVTYDVPYDDSKPYSPSYICFDEPDETPANSSESHQSSGSKRKSASKQEEFKKKGESHDESVHETSKKAKLDHGQGKQFDSNLEHGILNKTVELESGSILTDKQESHYNKCFVKVERMADDTTDKTDEGRIKTEVVSKICSPEPKYGSHPQEVPCPLKSRMSRKGRKNKPQKIKKALDRSQVKQLDSNHEHGIINTAVEIESGSSALKNKHESHYNECFVKVQRITNDNSIKTDQDKIKTEIVSTQCSLSLEHKLGNGSHSQEVPCPQTSRMSCKGSRNKQRKFKKAMKAVGRPNMAPPLISKNTEKMEVTFTIDQHAITASECFVRLERLVDKSADKASSTLKNNVNRKTLEKKTKKKVLKKPPKRKPLKKNIKKKLQSHQRSPIESEAEKSTMNEEEVKDAENMGIDLVTSESKGISDEKPTGLHAIQKVSPSKKRGRKPKRKPLKNTKKKLQSHQRSPIESEPEKSSLKEEVEYAENMEIDLVTSDSKYSSDEKPTGLHVIQKISPSKKRGRKPKKPRNIFEKVLNPDRYETDQTCPPPQLSMDDGPKATRDAGFTKSEGANLTQNGGKKLSPGNIELCDSKSEVPSNKEDHKTDVPSVCSIQHHDREDPTNGIMTTKISEHLCGSSVENQPTLNCSVKLYRLCETEKLSNLIKDVKAVGEDSSADCTDTEISDNKRTHKSDKSTNTKKKSNPCVSRVRNQSIDTDKSSALDKTTAAVQSHCENTVDKVHSGNTAELLDADSKVLEHQNNTRQPEPTDLVVPKNSTPAGMKHNTCPYSEGEDPAAKISESQPSRVTEENQLQDSSETDPAQETGNNISANNKEPHLWKINIISSKADQNPADEISFEDLSTPDKHQVQDQMITSHEPDSGSVLDSDEIQVIKESNECQSNDKKADGAFDCGDQAPHLTNGDQTELNPSDSQSDCIESIPPTQTEGTDINQVKNPITQADSGSLESTEKTPSCSDRRVSIPAIQNARKDVDQPSDASSLKSSSPSTPKCFVKLTRIPSATKKTSP